MNALVIHIPNLKYPFYVATGASTYGIRSVVYQAINQKIKYNALLQDLFLLLNVTIIPTNKSCKQLYSYLRDITNGYIAVILT